MPDTRLGDAAEPSFARHQTFAPRFGWLRKAFIAVNESQDAFLKPNAPVILGVGKNMVNAIRYWSVAFKLVVEHRRSGTSRAHLASPTWEACWLLSDDGADPYLEDQASLWLLHWWLLSPWPHARCWAPSWWVAFNALSSPRFSEAELAELITRHIRLAGWEIPALASISKDVDCLTKMYAPRRPPKEGSPGSFEDLLDCPFRELGLIEAVPGTGHEWRFTSTARTSLPPRLIAYACLDYVGRYGRSGMSVTLARLAAEPGAPGRAFQLGEPDIAAALDSVSRLHPELAVIDAVGQRSLVSNTDPQELAWDILDAHYRNAQRRVPPRNEWLASHPDLAAELRGRAQRIKQRNRAEDVA